MSWWLWAVIGLMLLGVELLTPGGFYILFFGVGALLVALLTSFGAVPDDWAQWLIFTLSSVVALGFFRKPLLDKFQKQTQGKEVDNLVGETAMATEPIESGGMGKVELRGSSWNARNSGELAIKKGDRLSVIALEGLTLSVKSK